MRDCEHIPIWQHAAEGCKPCRDATHDRSRKLPCCVVHPEMHDNDEEGEKPMEMTESVQEGCWSVIRNTTQTVVVSSLAFEDASRVATKLEEAGIPCHVTTAVQS